MLLFATKLFVAWWITAMSAVGVWLPIYYVRRTRDETVLSSTILARTKRPLATASNTATKFCLSVANCVSAGMLITMALMHFFPESFEVGAAELPANPASLCLWMLLGILIPAVLERSMKNSGGGHSHGVATGSDDDHSHGGSTNNSGGGVSTATLLIVLMCFHGMTEGLLLGFENKLGALLAAALPLSIHKFCDGLVIGVAKAKELYNQTDRESAGPSLADAESPLGSGDKPGSPSVRFWRHLYQGPVGVWLLLTPITMIGVVLCASPSSARNGASESIMGSLSPRQTVAVLSSSTNAAPSHGSVSTLAAVQAMGSGSFVFIGLGILGEEELKGVWANVALLSGAALTGGLFVLSSGAH